MKPIYFETQFSCGHVDRANAVIRDVTLITSGVTAEGHDLEVDDETLTQMLGCAKERVKVPVKLDHGSGIKDLNGYLDNFRLSGKKLIGDWHLLNSHEETPKMLERAERMPTCFGMSAAFKGSGVKMASGKKAARCFALKSVDCVTAPAANPDGMFSAREPSDRALAKALVLLQSKGVLNEFAGLRSTAGVSRSRNTGGQFAQEAAAAGGPDSNTMAAAYAGVIPEKVSRQRRILAAWKSHKVFIPDNEPLAMSATARALTMLAEKTREKSETSWKTYAGAAASGAVSGAALGLTPILKKGVKLRTALKSAATLGAASAGIVGGGAFIGSQIIGSPRPDEGSAFTRRAAIGGAIVGGVLGAGGVIAARKVPLLRKSMATLGKEWRPISAIQKASLPAAIAGGVGAGAVYGGAQGLDEGQQVDSIRNVRKDLAKACKPARQALFSARQKLINL
jgi:hypothetical protein